MNREVQAYFRAVPESRRGPMQKLHDAVMACFPKATVDLRYRMPTYSQGEGWVAIANQKAYVSLYTCSAAHLAAFREKHPEIKCGTGCINFRERDKIPLAAVKAVIRHAIRHPKAG